MRPGACAEMRISPPMGSTRPGADAAHCGLARGRRFGGASALAGVAGDFCWLKVCGT